MAARSSRRAIRFLEQLHSEDYLRLGIFYRRSGDAERALEAFERSGQLGARDQIAVVNIQDIRRSVPVGR